MGPGSCGYRSKAHDFDPDSEALLTFKTTSTDITHWQPTLVSDEGDHVVIRQASQVDHPPPRLSHGAAVCFYSLRIIIHPESGWALAVGFTGTQVQVTGLMGPASTGLEPSCRHTNSHPIKAASQAAVSHGGLSSAIGDPPAWVYLIGVIRV